MKSPMRINTQDLFEAGHSLAWQYLSDTVYPWEILPRLNDLIHHIGKNLDPSRYDTPTDGVWIAKTAKVSPTASIAPPAIIGENTEVRHCAFIRGSALVGDGCVVGNSAELKNCILSDGAQVPHFNYVGDSILGYKAHLGAGAVTSNVKSDRSPVRIKAGDTVIDTGLKKLGALLGDYAEIGCHAVLNPGSIIGKNATVYPTASVRGVVPANHILKAGKGVELSEKV